MKEALEIRAGLAENAGCMDCGAFTETPSSPPSSVLMVFFLTTIGGVKIPGYLPPIVVGVTLLIGLAIAYRLWRELQEDDDPLSTDELLAEFQEAHEAGELDDVEFRRVAALLRNPPVTQHEKPTKRDRPPIPAAQEPPRDPAPPGDPEAEDNPYRAPRTLHQPRSASPGDVEAGENPPPVAPD